MTSQNTTEYVDLKQAADYLVMLFKGTRKTYSCTRTKIGKLLSIVAFYYAKRNVNIFSEKIRRYDRCGTAIYELKGIVDSNVYLTDKYNDYEGCIDKEFIKECLSSESIANLLQKVSDDLNNPDVGKVIREAFVRFGAYPAANIGGLINKVIDIIAKYTNMELHDGDIIPLESLPEIPLSGKCALFDFLNDDSVLNGD